MTLHGKNKIAKDVLSLGFEPGPMDLKNVENQAENQTKMGLENLRF